MKQILVGLDGSPRAPRVLTTAINVARAQGARLTLVRTVGVPADLPQDFWKSTNEPLLDLLERRAREYLDGLAKDVSPDILGGVEVIVGVAWQAICDRAKSLDADLIVIGSHGYSGVDHLVGTTAAKVVNHAACSVLVVRNHAH
jgi:nucleotide-binding universal stress UspA family protein